MDDTITLTRDEYEALIDSRDHAIAMREIAAGAPTILESELDDFLAAPSSVAFFRKRVALTQIALANKIEISQAYLAQIESGARKGTVDIYLRLARALGVRVEDLVDD